jgi:hypothetical protein
MRPNFRQTPRAIPAQQRQTGVSDRIIVITITLDSRRKKFKKIFQDERIM